MERRIARMGSLIFGLVFGWTPAAHALIARAMDYTDTPTNPFTDRCDPTAPANCIDAELWNRVAELAGRIDAFLEAYLNP